MSEQVSEFELNGSGGTLAVSFGVSCGKARDGMKFEIRSDIPFIKDERGCWHGGVIGREEMKMLRNLIDAHLKRQPSK